MQICLSPSLWAVSALNLSYTVAEIEKRGIVKVVLEICFPSIKIVTCVGTRERPVQTSFKTETTLIAVSLIIWPYEMCKRWNWRRTWRDIITIFFISLCSPYYVRFTPFFRHHLLNLVKNSQCGEWWEIVQSNSISSPSIRSISLRQRVSKYHLILSFQAWTGAVVMPPRHSTESAKT